MPDEFEVLRKVNEVMPSLEKINKVLYEDEIPELVESALLLNSLIAELADDEGEPYIVDIARNSKSNLFEKVDLVFLPLELVQLVKKSFPDSFLDPSV